MAKRLTPQEADGILLAGQSPRYRELDRLQRIFDGTIYDGRPGWYDLSVDVPLQERKPCIQMPVVAAAVESNASFALGEGKFPAITSLCSEDDSDNGGLSKVDSVKLDAFNLRLIKTSRLEAASRQLLRMAQASRTAVAILGFRKGLPNVEAVWAKTCTPTFNPQDPEEVLKLDISYRFLRQVQDPQTAEWSPQVYQYRRVIDAQADTTFVPVLVEAKTDFPVPSTPDKTKTIVHGFGFCPVVWWRCMASAEPGIDIDGRAIHERVCDAVQALDRALSQRDRAALYCGDPQWFMTGVDPSNPVGPSGRAAVQPTPDNPTGDPRKQGQWGAAFNGNAGKAVTKKGPGVVWATENPSASAQLITLPGDALAAIDAHANDLLNKISEGMHVVRLDPIALRGSADISAKAMTIMYAKQLSRVAQLRQDFGDKCMMPILNLFYRMMIAKSAGVFVPGLANILPILQKSAQVFAGGVNIWFGPKLETQWPDYFDPSDADETAQIANSIAALSSSPPLITLQSAVEHIKSVFRISDCGKYVEALNTEKAQRQADAVANAVAMAAAVPPSAPPAQGAKPTAVPSSKTKAA